MGWGNGWERKAGVKLDRLGRNRKRDRLECDGYWFDSQLERDLYLFLKDGVKNGSFAKIDCQVSVHLGKARFLYKPDFKVTRPDGEEEYHEAKGFETDTWKR